MNSDETSGTISQPHPNQTRLSVLPSVLPTPSKNSPFTPKRRGKRTIAESHAAAKDDTPKIKIHLLQGSSQSRKRRGTDDNELRGSADTKKLRSGLSPSSSLNSSDTETDFYADEEFLTDLNSDEELPDYEANSKPTNFLSAPTMPASLTEYGLEDTPTNRMLLILMNKVDALSENSAKERRELKTWRKEMSGKMLALEQEVKSLKSSQTEIQSRLTSIEDAQRLPLSTEAEERLKKIEDNLIAADTNSNFSGKNSLKSIIN